ncbi:hypothetical protein S40293_01589 [Stachybotrys chartarum IBT 40293]|nr:hypothetical protein S40293_01589 [Stachybotrys chartarum IBT 40293]KFA77079.1 hypothetical protein S40288_07959 [Stachybotrys chartarum IBT 40288]
MKFTGLALCAFKASILAQAAPTTNCAKPPYFITTGDSTVATGGGWGDGLMSFLTNSAAGVNTAKNGATTVSFRDEGLWDTSIAAVKANSQEYSPIVTIQFGHNDQKPEKNISLAQYQQNLETMAREVQHAGGTPILVTSLTRRRFRDGKVVENLVDQRSLTIAAAAAVGIDVLDLNKASTDYINAIGDANATFYDMEADDKTHLSAGGKIVFGRMVADLLLREREDLAVYFEENTELSDKIWAGVFATGSE